MKYKSIFPTKWPLFEFYLRIWKLTITTAVFTESIESLTYQYVAFLISWKGENKFKFRLYDTEIRKTERIDEILMMEGSTKYTIKKLREIRKVALEEIKNIKLLEE